MRKSKTLTLLILLLVRNFIFGQSSIQGLTQQGLTHIYNMEFDSALKIFEHSVEKFPNDPLGYYHLARLHFWFFIGNKEAKQYYSFLKYSELAQQKIDKLIEDKKVNERIYNAAGNLASYKAMASAVNNSTADALWFSKKALDYFEKTLEINPQFCDAYFGLGLLDYAMSFVPDFLHWAVNLTGLSSNKERGLQYLKTAYRRGNHNKTEIAFHLSKIYSDYLADYDSSYIYIKKIIGLHPKNTMFHYQYAVTLIRDKKFDLADNSLNKVIKLNNKSFPQVTALAHYRKGEIFFKKNQFANAIKHYKIFLDESKEIDFTGYAALNIAISSKILDDDVEYNKYIQLARQGSKDLFEDSYAKDVSERFIKNNINKDDLFLIKIKNKLDAGNFKVVYDSLKTKHEYFQKEQKALALLYFSEAALKIKKLDEAVNSVEDLRKLKIDCEKWVIPRSYLLEAIAYIQIGDNQRAKEFIKLADDNNLYEFMDSIQARIENLKRKLNH